MPTARLKCMTGKRTKKGSWFTVFFPCLFLPSTRTPSTVYRVSFAIHQQRQMCSFRGAFEPSADGRETNNTQATSLYGNSSINVSRSQQRSFRGPIIDEHTKQPNHGRYTLQKAIFSVGRRDRPRPRREKNSTRQNRRRNIWEDDLPNEIGRQMTRCLIPADALD